MKLTLTKIECLCEVDGVKYRLMTGHNEHNRPIRALVLAIGTPDERLGRELARDFGQSFTLAEEEEVYTVNEEGKAGVEVKLADPEEVLRNVADLESAGQADEDYIDWLREKLGERGLHTRLPVASSGGNSRPAEGDNR